MPDERRDTDAIAFLAGNGSASSQPPQNGAAPNRPPSWEPVDLAPFLDALAAGESAGPAPSLLSRSDGQALLYPGEVHSLAGEPESGKGWVALAEAARLIDAGEDVLYLDFEDSPANVAGRLLALGAQPDAVAERFVYVRPEEPSGESAPRDLRAGRAFKLAVVDGLTEAYGVLGLDPYSNLDAVAFLRAVARPLAGEDTAVLLLDHVVKDKDARGRWALGAGHKVAGVTAAYSIEAVERPSRTSAGKIELTLQKDRHGGVPGERGEIIAVATITPADEGRSVRVQLDPPDNATATGVGGFRPTFLMEKVSRYVEAHPGAGRNEVRSGVKGKNDVKDLALQTLVDEGWIERAQAGQKQSHTSVRPFREDADDGDYTPTGPLGPDWAPTGPRAQSRTTGPLGPLPYGGDPAQGPASRGAADDNRAPDESHADDELRRLAAKGLVPADAEPDRRTDDPEGVA